jgi:hypothetical protein
MQKLKVAHIGTGRRSREYFLPILAQLKDQIELVAICGRSREKVEPLGRKYGIPWYTNQDQMLDKHGADFVTAIVSCMANYDVAEQLAKRGKSCILETPIEIPLRKAYGLLELEKKYGVNIEVAENWHRKPIERLAKKMLNKGMFGKVLMAYNDLDIHGYHALGNIRSYIGFDVAPSSVTALHPVLQRSSGKEPLHSKLGMIEFANGSVGLHSIAYGHALGAADKKGVTAAYFGRAKENFSELDPVRKRFIAEKGWMAWESGVYLDKGKPKKFKIKKATKKIGGKLVTQKVSVDTMPSMNWVNPFAAKPFNEEELSIAAVIMSMAAAVSKGIKPEYSLQSALWDYEIDSAMCSSHAHGKRVLFPLDLDQIQKDRDQKLY